MLYKFSNEELEPIEFLGYKDLKGKEKDLENLLAFHLKEIFIEDDGLMPIFQERPRQEEPDICALNKAGDLIIFELKRESAGGDAAVQVLRYAQKFGQKTYRELNEMFNTYRGEVCDLAAVHADSFGLAAPLPFDAFNKAQKLMLVGNSSDMDLMRSVDYWQKQGVDVDFIPYRFYKIHDEYYFEFFSKPYDFHINPKVKKAIMFDTNRAYNAVAIWDMLANQKISGYGNAASAVDRFNKNDVVLYYHKGYGVIAAGTITSAKSASAQGGHEGYRTVRFLTPVPTCEAEIKALSSSEIEQILDKTFYLATTAKTPYLTLDEADKLISALNAKYAGA